MTKEPYTRYPISSIILYNSVTLLHFLLGSVGIIIGYDHLWWAYGLGIIYLLFATSEMWILMPIMVCPNCVYYAMEDGVCVSGMNLVSRKIAKQGEPRFFKGRSEGMFCHNNLYMAGLILPLVIMAPALILNFSVLLLGLFVSVVGLFLFRVFVIFFKVACAHCHAKYVCPNAESMGIVKKEVMRD